MPKKIERKLKRCQHIVEKETGVHCVARETRHLAICNAGLVNGLTMELIYEEFNKYGSIEDIVMLPEKSCCFLSFKNISSANNAYEAINGNLNIGQNNKPIYLSYVAQIPEKLHPDSNLWPPGLFILEDFISELEERTLLDLVTFNSNAGCMKNRQVKHYGYEFRYGTNDVDKDSPLNERIPPECEFLWTRLITRNTLFDHFKPDQLTVNYYLPGQGIPSHVDTHSTFEDPIISLSLGSSVVMNFKNACTSIPVVLPQRSIVIMSGDSRYGWTHSIIPKKSDVIATKNGLTLLQRKTRMSYTFRKIRVGECNCEFTEKCDSHMRRAQEFQITDDMAVKLENVHVHNVYNVIADHFSNTRHKQWPNVVRFLKMLDCGSFLIDIGCGNGKYLQGDGNMFRIGCDRSTSLLDVCKERGFEVFTCNCLNLPLKNNCADAIISIAVIHHLANEERRLQAICEMLRVLKIKGKALVYVWAKDQNKNKERTSYLKQDRKNKNPSNNVVDEDDFKCVDIENQVVLPVHSNRKQFQHQDLLVPWKSNVDSGKTSFLRFYHVFEERELESLCSKAGNVRIIENYYDQGNWCCIFEKL